MAACPTVFYGGVIFSVFPLWFSSRLPGPGVYMLCRRSPAAFREILYIGESADLATTSDRSTSTGTRRERSG